MPNYAHITHKVTLIGDMFGGLEEWSTGFFMGDVGGGDFAQPPTQLETEEIAALWSTVFATPAMGISTHYRFLGCKVSYMTPSGVSDPSYTKYHWLPTPTVGTNAAVPFPPQIALVATLTTDKARGYGSKGRMYLPGINHTVTSSGKLDVVNTDAVSGLMATFLYDVNQNANIQGVVVLNSAASVGVPGHAAEMNPITGVRVGSVYDTQRRRRNALNEQYSVTPLID